MHHNLLHTTNPIHEWEHAPGSFDELLISWNARRPERGHFALDVSVLQGVWSSWLPYAEWGDNFQRGFVEQADGIRVDQDTVEAPGSRAFRIRVRAENGASMQEMRALHVCASCKQRAEVFAVPDKSLHLPVPPISQMALDDPRRKRLCSPTSLTALLRYFAPHNKFQPLAIADKVWDAGSDIYGNWVLNVAEGYAQLGGEYFCWAERLLNLKALFERLPVAISVRGPLAGSAEAYASGHLLVVKGFDAEKGEVLCMDPAFPTDAETDIRYPINDLDAAWQRRGRIAYVFRPSFA